MKHSSFGYTLFLVLGDFLALVAAFVTAYILRVSISDAPIATPVGAIEYFKAFLVLLPFWILIFALIGLYKAGIYEKRFMEFGRLLVGSFIGLLFVIFYDFLTIKPLFPAKLVPIYGFTLAFIFLVLFRNIARFIRSMLFGYDVGITNILIVGNTAISDELLESLRDSRDSGYRVLGVVGNSRREYHSDFATFTDALKYLKKHSSSKQNGKKHELQGIIQTELYPLEDRNREILDFAQEHHISYRFIPGNTELFVGNIDVELFRSGVPVIAVHQTPLFGWGRFAKRTFDLIVSSLLLIILSVPLLLIALAIKLFDGNGPIFLRQVRLTRFDQEFRVFKFRTVKAVYNGLSPEDAFTKMGKPELIAQYRSGKDEIPNDPRFTKIGVFLRHTSLDELPQLFNVILGDISLVGPRPLVPEELRQFKKHHTILSVQSGMTGLATVSGRRDILFEERRKLDMYYVQNWSFWLDIMILLKTIRVVLARSGAR
jgi:exopolysaccharide biosynthesis polyprenyl glycosylphosphotransferase